MRVRNKTMPAISSKTGLGVALKAVVPQPAISLGPRLRRRNCGISQGSGGILTRNTRGWTLSSEPRPPRESGPEAPPGRSERLFLLALSPPSKGIHMRLSRFGRFFSCLQSASRPQNRFRPDLLTKYKRFDATLTKSPDSAA